MIKESCNLMGKEYIYVTRLKAYVIHYNNTILFLRTQLIFHSEIFLLWPYHTHMSGNDWICMTTPNQQ